MAIWMLELVVTVNCRSKKKKKKKKKKKQRKIGYIQSIVKSDRHFMDISRCIWIFIWLCPMDNFICTWAN